MMAKRRFRVMLPVDHLRRLPPEQIAVISTMFTERELQLIENARLYATSNPAGLPGHDLLVIIDKLVSLAGWMLAGHDLAEMGNILNRLEKDDG